MSYTTNGNDFVNLPIWKKIKKHHFSAIFKISMAFLNLNRISNMFIRKPT